MSCAEGSEANCEEVLDQVFEYLHGELDDDSIALVRTHLDECSPCLREFGLEDAVRKLLAKSCGCTHAPENLRQQVLTRITQVRVSVQTTDGNL
jgi:mycothiol system anti-sigma-R factor